MFIILTFPAIMVVHHSGRLFFLPLKKFRAGGIAIPRIRVSHVEFSELARDSPFVGGEANFSAAYLKKLQFCSCAMRQTPKQKVRVR